jgi:sulfite reductase alpha subunit-like flavoprotein
VVLFVSTTGDGEQPDNMKRVWRQLYVCVCVCVRRLRATRERARSTHVSLASCPHAMLVSLASFLGDEK